MLLRRVSALGRALLFVGGLALTALASTAREHPASVPTDYRDSSGAQASIEPSDALPAHDIRGGEQVELVSTDARSAVRPPVPGFALAARRRAPTDCLRADALRWCDVIQCRRLGGALLLGFATPPPAHS